MSDWEHALRQLISNGIHERYEVMPARTGPILICTTCNRIVTDAGDVRLSRLAEEAEKHEDKNHS